MKNHQIELLMKKFIEFKAGTGIDLCHLSFLDPCTIQVVSQIKTVYIRDDKV